MSASEAFFIGVDVGTGSARASLFNSRGKAVASGVAAIKTWNPQTDHFEQSSDDIWRACKEVLKVVIDKQDVAVKGRIRGIGFDATCSLVALDADGKPLTVSTTGSREQNVILWMDHRAQTERELINATKHQALKQVGGSISVEMQPPKLLWIKKNLPETWKAAGHFFDLPDFLTYKATGNASRSLCSVVCKWCYKAGGEGHGWDRSFLQAAQVEDLARDDFRRIGKDVLAPGSAIPGGLLPELASELGLSSGVAVATSLIDAHAGGVGILGCRPRGVADVQTNNCMALICGTSTCHMAVSEEPLEVPGVWGPYWSAMLPRLYLHEAGQSAAGKLVDFVIESHPAYPTLLQQARDSQRSLPEELEALLQERARAAGLGDITRLTKDLHLYPDFHGNRSPLADPSMKGMVMGLTLDSSLVNLALSYLAVLQGLAYSTREILGVLQAQGYRFRLLIACGGLCKHQLFLQTHADITGIPIALPEVEGSVTLGAAMLGATASGSYESLEAAMGRMCGDSKLISPDDSTKRFHDAKYRVYKLMQDTQIQARSAMASATS